jgi:hypothetical protein
LVVARGKITGIKRVPTVLLVDNRGVVTHLWTGGVEPGKEKQTVADFFDGKEGVEQSLESIDLGGLEELKRKNLPFQVVDITTSKKSNSSAPLVGELFIPSADLAVRGQYELDRGQRVILDCRTIKGYQCQDALISLRNRGFEHPAGLMLGHLGKSPACEDRR